MASIKPFCAAIFVLGAVASGSVAAHGVRFGFNFGFPLFPLYAPFYYPAPVYYPPQVITVPAAPVYVERNEAQAAPAPEHYWYYCPDSQTYYPYVQQCAGAWQRVSPRPPGS